MTNTTYNFEAQTERLLELLTHSIYSNKEIFLRELISNASDAIDKAKIKSLTDTNYLWENNNFEIKITVDEKNKTIKITDNWVWMTRDEAIKNLWTIAKSGTKDFIEKLKESKEQNNLIWQFWVWFYSAFMVCDKVEVLTKSNESDESIIWTSNWKWSFEVISWDKKDRWTEITLFLKEDEKEFLEEWKLRELIKKYSNYVWVAIKMLEVENETNKENRNFEQINEAIAPWNKSKSEITDEEYKKLYTDLTYDYNAPLWNIYLNTEWALSYKSILFVPHKKNMFLNFDDPSKEYGPKLYVQNILILDHAKDLLPIYLRFISWVVQTSDLPLNISREMLQSNPTLEKIKKWLTKKILDKLAFEMKENPANYDEFLADFGKTLKEWIYYDNENMQKIAWVVKFESLLKNKKISLDEYLETALESDKKEENSEEKPKKTIYYILAKSHLEAKSNPYLEQFEKKNIDVLLLSDPIDEWIVWVLKEYNWNKIISITSNEVNLEKDDEEAKKDLENTSKDYKDLLEFIKNTVWNDKLEKVQLTKRIWDNIWALALKEWNLTPQMEKMMKAMWQEVPSQKRILELNPENEFVKNMMSEFKADLKSEKLKDMMLYAYEQAILLEWWELQDIKWFISRVNKYIK